jgi:hypothetical protein
MYYNPTNYLGETMKKLVMSAVVLSLSMASHITEASGYLGMINTVHNISVPAQCKQKRGKGKGKNRGGRWV